MRLAVISDIHGNVLALEAVLADIGQQKVDWVVDLGDRVSGPLWPRETFERLAELGVPGVRGNHDRIVGLAERDRMGPSDGFAHDQLSSTQRAALADLPFRAEFVPGVAAFHATPEHDDRYLIDDIRAGSLHRAAREKIMRRLGNAGTSVVLVGHSHRADFLRLENGVCIVNPGSVGDPAYEDPTGERHVSEAGAPHARYAILDVSELSRPDVTFRAVPYDFERAASRAEQNNRPDWAHALRMGFLPARPGV